MYTLDGSNEGINVTTYCICEEEEHGDMIACENPHCHIEWFHFPCVGIFEAPKGPWFCDYCKN